MALFLMLAIPVSADSVDFPVDSVIHLEKNTNRNQVHYRVLVDEACHPRKKKPVEAYWRELEKGPDVTEPLMFWEQPGYGVKQPESVAWTDTGGEFEFRIRGVAERVIRLQTFPVDGQCRARAYTTINGKPAVFERIEIDVSGWATVHRVEIFGVDADGISVSEITHSKP